MAAVTDFEQVDGRIMPFTISNSSPSIHFVNMYAPQSGCDVATKQAFYTKADSFLRSFPSAHPMFIAGDFNARLHGKLPEERDILGNFIYGRGLTYLQHMAAATAENRSHFIDILHPE